MFDTPQIFEVLKGVLFYFIFFNLFNNYIIGRFNLFGRREYILIVSHVIPWFKKPNQTDQFDWLNWELATNLVLKKPNNRSKTRLNRELEANIYDFASYSVFKTMLDTPVYFIHIMC